MWLQQPLLCILDEEAGDSLEKSTTASTGHLLSYCFRDSAGRVLASLNSGVPVIPASNMKVITGFLAYSILGPEHRLNTYADVKGNELIISGGPTPLLSGKRFDEFCAKIETFGGFADIRKIVFTAGTIDGMTAHPDWQIGDAGQVYQPEITNFSVDENCVPVDREGRVQNSDDLHYNESKYRAASNAMESAASRIWTGLGLRGKPEYVSSPGPARGEVVHEETISDILAHVEPPSCNYSSEVLSKYIVHNERAVPGTWDLWPEVAKSKLKTIVSDLNGTSFRDGSGLSRENYVTTRFMTDFIGNISRSKYSDFLNYLPSIGNGTLKNRLKGLKDTGIRAKTGSLGGVSSLSGIMQDQNVSFSVIVNNFTDSNSEPSALIDECIYQFAENGDLKVE